MKYVQHFIYSHPFELLYTVKDYSISSTVDLPLNSNQKEYFFLIFRDPYTIYPHNKLQTVSILLSKSLLCQTTSCFIGFLISFGHQMFHLDDFKDMLFSCVLTIFMYSQLIFVIRTRIEITKDALPKLIKGQENFVRTEENITELLCNLCPPIWQRI